jgi:hypothetical protein
MFPWPVDSRWVGQILHYSQQYYHGMGEAMMDGVARCYVLDGAHAHGIQSAKAFEFCPGKVKYGLFSIWTG